MADTPNGGNKSFIQNTQIHQVYDWLLQQKQCGWLQFRRAVVGYTSGGSVIGYAAGGSTEQMVYDAKTITYTVGGQTREFYLPKMSYIGYTKQELGWIDSFYGALVRRLQSGDVAFINSPAMQELANAVQNQRDIFSLRAPDGIPGGGTPGGHKGVGFRDAFDNDPQQETIVFSEDLKILNDANTISDARFKAEFVSRVFHEMLHRNWAHNVYAYDMNRDPQLGRNIIANLNDPFDINDMRQLDRVYGETKNALVALASDPQLGLSTSQLDAVFKDGTEGALQSARNHRTQMLYQQTGIALSNGVVDFTPADLKLLDKRGLIKLKPYPADIDTPEEKADFARHEENYVQDAKYIKNLPTDHLKDCTNVNYTSMREGVTSVGQAVDLALEFAREFFAEYSAEVGQAFGSALGRHVARYENPATQLAASTVLGVVGQNLGEIVEFRLRGFTADASAYAAFRNIVDELKQAGAGAISSFLTAELFEALNLEGVLAEVGQSIFSSGLTAIIQNLPGLAAGTTQLSDVLQGVQVGNIIGGYIGTRLASELVEFDTIGGQIGASIGSGIGALVGGMTALESAAMGAKLGSFAGPIGALIGAFVGYILGGLIGSLFGGTPRSGADVAWDGTKFAVTRVWSKSGGSKDAARSIATTVADVVNGTIAATGAKLTSADGVRIGAYGMRGKDFVYWATGGAGAGERTFKSRNSQDVINHGTAIALHDLLPRMVGGDVYVKRAVAATLTMASGNPASNYAGAAGSFDINVLLGNISTAQDYGGYLADRNQIDVLIAADPNSAFAAGWSITLARALELGLTRRSSVDWGGGWTVYLDEKVDGRLDGEAFNPATMAFTFDPANRERLFVFRGAENELLGVLGDTIDSALKDHVVGTGAADTIVVSGARITNVSGLTINGQVPAAGDYEIRVSALIDAGAGDDTVIAGDLGNDVAGGDGNDTLVGGNLDDWLFGGMGNDRLFAGAANYQFADGNAAATAAALNVVSNGDLLDGGDGNDVLYGSRGSDWLRGAGGVDTIHGGAGGDIIDGGAGDDRGANGEARLFGGAGTDQYVFNYGDGRDVIFDESDNASGPGAVGDSLYNRVRNIDLGVLQRNWAGGGDYEVDGSVRGGEDAIAFGAGIDFEDLILQRSGTEAAPGQDLIIRLTAIDPVSGQRLLTGDELVIKDWFETTRRVEWLRFADGQDVRIGHVTSFIVGTAGADVIFGTNGADFIVGTAGNDVIRGLNGDDFGFAGAGDDLIAGDADNDLVSGGDGNDSVIGSTGNDTALGDDGNDSVYGGAGFDILAGGRGDDQLIGGDGDDIFRYERGDGQDVVFDALVNNWELVWQAGTYQPGYQLDTATGVVTKDGVVVFDGTRWIGTYDYTDVNQTFYRHLGAVGGALGGDSGVDYLEFGIGINIQDLMLRRTGSDLEIAVTTGDGDGRSFDAVSDRITLRDWYLSGASVENFVFAATGRHDISGWTLAGGTEGADTLAGSAGVDWITGNGGDDVITGEAGADILSGNGGSDILRGGADNDVLFGGDADDLLEGGAGADQLLGGSGVDIASYATATTTAIRAFLNAPASNSRDAAGDVYTGIEGLEGTTGGDRLGGNDGANVLRGLGGNDTLYGGAGDDIYEIDANHAQDTIIDGPFITSEVVNASGVFNSSEYSAAWTYLGFLTTASGDRHCYRLVVTRNATGEEVYRSRDQVDFIYTTGATRPLPGGSSWPASNSQWRNGAARTNNGTQVAHEILLAGDGGSDTLDFGAGIFLSNLTFQRLNGGADLRVTYTTNNFVTIVGQNDATRAVEALQLSDGLTADLTRLVLVGETASAGDDLVVGDVNANTLDGLAGDDVLSGGNGTDTLRGGDGDDILEGGGSGDVLDGGSDSVTAGLAPSSSEQTRQYGDTIRYVGSNAAVTIDLAARTAAGGHAAGDTIVGIGGVSTIENVVGSQGFNDTLRGDDRANRLAGLGGNDILEGRAGNDALVGGAGDDTLRGGDGEDNIAGDDGIDTIEGGNDKDLLSGGAGDDSLLGDAGEDVLSGGDGADVLRGGSEADRLGGDAGNDQLYGDAGNDQLVGGDGNDALYGGDGDDTLAGDGGDDQLAGDAGNDTYVFDTASGNDTIVDAAGSNRIAIGGVTREQIWLTRSGNDLRIGIIGGTASITVQNYYAATNPTRIREIALTGHSLFLSYCESLIQTMTQSSATVPAQLPDEVAATLSDFWHEGGRAMPAVTNQTRATSEDTAISGSVGAIDHDENIAAHEVSAEAALGTVAIDAATGAWTYTPAANLYGQDTFDIVITDADGNRVVQTVTVDITSVNDAPSDIALAGAPAGIEERDRPVTGTVLNPVVLGTLSATDVDAPDAGDFATHVFAVSDSRFEIVNGNVLRLRAGAALDFETSPTVTVAVTVTDRNGAGLSFTRNFTLSVLDRDDYFYGTAGDDTITGTAGRNLIYGQGGNDTLTGANANDDIDGGDGADNLFGQGGDDTLLGGLSDDVLDGGAGVDILRGGDGVDTLRGQDGADLLFGDGGNDLLQGGIGDDQLDGGADNDRLEGDAGADRLVGGTGDDTLIGGAGADRFLGGTGVDIISYATAAAGIIVNVTTTTGSAGDALGDVFEDSVERLIGSGFGDTITGSAASETLEGGAGSDAIYGGAGNDTLLGGDGDDTLDAQSGNDMLDGGAGSDILIGGDDSDTYLLDVNAGADEIRNFDPNGTDIDVIGYQSITREQLWFERSGNDLVVAVVGTSVRTTIRDWYLTTTASDRANYKIDFFLATGHVTQTIDAEGLVTLMAGYTRPTTQAQFDTLRANTAFFNSWALAWNLNAPPSVPSIANQTINEDGTLSLALTITDDFTPANGVSVTVQAVRTDNYAVEDLSTVNAPTISAADANGNRTLTVTTRPNASGQVAIRVRAVDAGGLETERVFLLTIAAVADAPTITVAQAATPTTPLTQPTLDSGFWSINLQAALTDQDGSETLEVRIANVPSGITFNAGTNLGGGVWSFTPAQLPGLRVQGPATWSQDLALSITAISRETATGQTATSAATALNIVINARPTDIWADRALAFNENTAPGTGLAWLGRTDGDAGDAATYELLNSAGGRFTLRSDGLLSTGAAILDYESATSHTITVRVTDSGGLSRTEDFVVSINNVNEVPTNIWADRTLGFNETTGTWTGIAWFGASDPEGNVASYSLVNDAGGRFYMNSNGLLSTGGTPLNYEEATGHWITVRATDAGGLYRDQSFWIDVYNVNEAPTLNAPSFVVNEGANGGPGNRLVTTGGSYAVVTGSDPEGVALSYQLIGGDTGMFTIDTAGNLYQQGVLDYETRTSYSVSVRAWDGGSVGAGNFVDRVVPITVANVNEGPKIVAYTSAGSEGGGWPNVLHIGFQAVDPEGHAITGISGGGTLGDSWTTSTTDSLYIAILASMASQHPTFNITLTDSQGAQATSTVQILTSPLRGVVLGPVVLDLDGNGVELVAREVSNVFFDMDGNGLTDPTGWVGAGDGLLALDRNGDGYIGTGAEISFIQDVPHATSDLEGLAAYDTNENGYFDRDDERFAEFRVWRDANQDGVSQAEELRSLADHGITAINLTRSMTGATPEGAMDNVTVATSEYVRTDGSTGQVGDVWLAYGARDLEVTILDTEDAQTQPDQDVAAALADTGWLLPESQLGDGRDLVEFLRDGLDGRAPAIDEIDRSSNDSVPASLRPRGGDERFDPRFRGPGAAPERADEEPVAQSSTDDSAPEAAEPQRTPAPHRWRLSDWELNGEDMDGAEPQLASQPAAARGALHAGLDSISRRRLQMIEAMASFSAEGAADLSLQPQRRVDARTLELLTSVPTVRVA